MGPLSGASHYLCVGPVPLFPLSLQAWVSTVSTWSFPVPRSVYTYGRRHQRGALGLCLSLPTEAVVVTLPRFCVNTELHVFHREGWFGPIFPSYHSCMSCGCPRGLYKGAATPGLQVCPTQMSPGIVCLSTRLPRPTADPTPTSARAICTVSDPVSPCGRAGWSPPGETR